MGRKNARSVLTSKMPRRQDGKFCAKPPVIVNDTESSAAEEEPVEENDWELLDLTTDMMVAGYYRALARLEKETKDDLRALNKRDSRPSSIRNKRKAKGELEANKDKKVRTLADFGFSVPVKQVSPTTTTLIVDKKPNDKKLEKIRGAFEMISDKLNPLLGSDNQLIKSALFEDTKQIVLRDYFRRLLENSGKIEASERAAELMWDSPSKYCGAKVRAWAKEFLELGGIPGHQQDKHDKRSSIVDDEDLKKE
ncbi:hypothetical protein PHYBLDRAFT_142862 [Phycomyces blakesleeanus NRRL 1555(-)]|uniref:Uncharacterized protein n=1 Tax=Phycomyces blakesleeanus (strain ATCC 8743b / DSM 1359 / FGSC 10004 / NBRC 33097 / NRRL 1555) TaxID=763407 RepID=A0A167NGT8_PHYB8|nr:hypothetical protein PHYBLDRAFT_142862 [Phycomyces blakesleeanus NRRL 1555(-)]OAD75878.1 hypothetical protein PHYBLDRAFT_142862 [Phycomyces blakesleeanus NRRL 1555(-)]|eukprot:XP_018293918.1 hypothetical protein PHYBLDRAFT_142862 [Phycomyces blakesleeanus NRRL 1555(-)]